MITYTTTTESITPDMLTGFFDGWPNPPSQETHLRLLQNSHKIVLALDESTNRVVGFITAISDGVLTAYIPLLEVLPSYKSQGIGKQLTQHMLAQLSNYYMVDLLCDQGLQPFYQTQGMHPTTGMFLRNYTRQSGQ